MFKNILRFLLPTIILFVGCTPEHDFKIEILDDSALQLLDPNTEIKVIGSGFKWTEGPVWVEEGSYLLFSDIPNNTVFKIDAEGELSPYLKPSGYLGSEAYGNEPGSNGLLLDAENRLILMQHGERRVARMKSSLDDPKPEYEVLTDNYQGKRFNSPNDGVFDKAGNLYFTDPPYGLPKQMEDPGKALDFQGVYCLNSNGETILLDKLSRPNGIALSPDETELFVAVSNPKKAVWFQYDIDTVGSVKNRRLFYDVTELIGQEGEQGLPDGMKMHSSGNLFATGPGGVWIFDPNGKPLARILTGQATANCAFSTDEKTLFMTADDFVLQMDLQ